VPTVKPLTVSLDGADDAACQPRDVNPEQEEPLNTSMYGV